MSIRITGAKVILADEVVETDVVIEDDTITGIGSGGAAEILIDGTDKFLAPALVDIHGDAFERQVMPRPNVFFPMEAALLDTDRQLAANGIATAYHALTLSWEPGLRSVERGQTLIDTLERLSDRLTVENRVQLRWESFAFEAMDLIEQSLQGALLPSIAFNDHTSMTMRSFDVPLQERAFEQSEDFAIADPDDDRLRKRIAGNARRSGLSEDAYLDMLAEVWERRDDVDEAIRQIADLGATAGAPMLSHDDTQVTTREYYRGLGAHIAEFPMSIEVADAARLSGDYIVFGAPNAVRGGSHIGSPSAGDMVEAGLCDVLASDYFYPAMLAGVARLHDERRAPLHDLWSLISKGPAEASGLDDRGEIAVDKRADLVLLDWPESETPAVTLTLSGGRVAYQAVPNGS